MNRERMLERFLSYVKVNTTAVEQAGVYPSSTGQIELGKLLVQELNAMGIADVHQDHHGIVVATLPSNVAHAVPTVAFNSHFDTSPETTGANVKPNVIKSYSGGDIQLGGDTSKVIRVADNPELTQLIGSTLITTDGTTLLGGDDKAGLTIIMEMIQHFLEHPELEHGPVRVLFTCDEEIGLGVEHVNVEQLNATACYTFDGGGHDLIDVETFSADLAMVHVRGVNIHPSIAKDKMINAIRSAGDFVASLSADQSPERTSGRQGFMHPYTIEGGVAEVTIKVLLRDFHTPSLTSHADQLTQLAREVEARHPGAQIEVEVRPQYRNMTEGLSKEPRAVEFAKLAHERLGRSARLTIIRGGTDGSQLTARGLPTPNLSSGQHNPHSPLEWACLDEMHDACQIGIEICRIWASETKPRD